MAHKFTMKATIDGVSIEQFQRLVADTTLHEKVCKQIPCENLKITESKIVGNVYTLKREYNLDVNIPDIAKKLLKDAFRLKRTDITQLDALSSTIELGANLPLKARAKRVVTGDDKKIDIQLDWEIKLSVPLIGGMLEKHAEGEIRKFSEIEVSIVEAEVKSVLSS